MTDNWQHMLPWAPHNIGNSSHWPLYDFVLQPPTTLVIVTVLTHVIMTVPTHGIVSDLLREVHLIMFLPLLQFIYYVCHVLSCDVHVTSYCHSSTVHLFGIDTSLWYCPPLQRPTEVETAPSCTAALLEAVLQCVSLEEVVLKSCSFGM